MLKYLPLIGAFNVSAIYLMMVGGVVGALLLFIVAKLFGNIIFAPEKGDSEEAN